jgi:hypothetical protein
VHVPRRVRELLECAGLFSLLSTEKQAA